MTIIAPAKIKIRFILSLILVLVFSVLTLGTKYVIDKKAISASMTFR
jgi:hypothetical protein